MTLPDEYFGVSEDAFREYMQEQEQLHAFPTKWQGQSIDLPVYRIDVTKPRYNHKNGRIIDSILEYCSGQSIDTDYFEQNDPSSTENQKIFYGFIEKNPQRDNAFNAFKVGMIPSYTDPLVCTPDGRIINGNQRLSVFRELFHDNERTYEHLSHIWVAILPENGTEVDYRRLERRLQEGGVLDHEVFDWIQTGLNRRRDLEEGDTPENIAEWANTTVEEVTESVRKIDIVDLYLEYQGTPGAYYTIRLQNHTQSVIELDNGMKKLDRLSGTDNNRLIETFCEKSFQLMSDPESVKGSGIGVYGHIRLILDMLVEEARNVRPRAVSGAANARLNRRRHNSGEEEGTTDEEDSILGLPEADEDDATNLAEAIRDEHEIRKGRREAANERTYASRMARQVVGTLQNIVDRWGAHDLEGFPEQLEEIESLLSQIQERLGEGE